MTISIQDLESNISEQKVLIELGKSLERLKANRDFQKIIENEYLKNEAVRLVHLKAAYNCQSEVDQSDIVKRIDAIGCFKHFLNAIEFNHDQAIKEIEMHQSTIDELIEEGSV